MYPAAARELKAELLNTLPGNLVNSKFEVPMNFFVQGTSSHSFLRVDV